MVTCQVLHDDHNLALPLKSLDHLHQTRVVQSDDGFKKRKIIGDVYVGLCDDYDDSDDLKIIMKCFNHLHQARVVQSDDGHDYDDFYIYDDYDDYND